MKINKISRGLALIPLTGMISLMGTPMAFAAECSTLSPCVVDSVPVVSSASHVLSNTKVQVTAPAVESVTAPITRTVDNVTAPVVDAVVAPAAETVNKVTTPVADTVNSVVAPITPVLLDPVPVVPQEPVAIVKPPASSVVPVAAEGTSAEIVTPPDTKSASETAAPAQLHDSSAVAAGALNGTATSAPSLDFQRAAVHSSQGAQTKIINSGAFGFGHLNPMDDPVGFAGLVFAYIIVLGSAIGFAVKRSAFLNFRGIA